MVSTKSKLPKFCFNARDIQAQSFTGVEAAVRKCYKKYVQNLVIFIVKYLCWSLFLIKLQNFRPATLLKSDSNTGVFL